MGKSGGGFSSPLVGRGILIKVSKIPLGNHQKTPIPNFMDAKQNLGKKKFEQKRSEESGGVGIGT